jgi:hypothetical protein
MHRREFLIAGAAGALCAGPASASSPKAGDHCLVSQAVGEHDFVTNDEGTGAKADVQIFRARVPAGYHLLGDTAVGGLGAPIAATIVVKEVNSELHPDQRPILAPAVGARRMWGFHGKRGLAFYSLIPPPNYVSIGGTVSDAYRNYMCVHKDWVKPAAGIYWVYNDHGSGAKQDQGEWADVSLWSSNDLPGTFFLRGDYEGWRGEAYRPMWPDEGPPPGWT